MNIKVTNWTHPSTDSYLVLEGSAEETRSQAEQYFESDPSALMPEESEMDEAAFLNLPEFEG